MLVTEYSPVAGLTIKEALQRAKEITRHDGGVVVATINDVVMCITQKTNIEEALSVYSDKLAFKYETEKIKRSKQR